MSNRKVPRLKKSQIRTITYDPHITSVIATRDRVVYPNREAYEIDQTFGDDGKICTVCLASYSHEPKCTNKRLLLEGSKRSPAK